MVAQYQTMLTGLRAAGDPPAGFHWCLSPDVNPASDLGRDGHPRPGIYLPKLPFPRRMWAGGEVQCTSPLLMGETVDRTSTVTGIEMKTGRSGKLAFVTVEHDYQVAGEHRLKDRQDIVYREDPDPNAPKPVVPAGEAWDAMRVWKTTPDETLLFRYSAITFNGHRIHYDHPYATQVEGYDGLVVHGPLQATWMQNLAADIFGQQATKFSYRGLSPLIAGQEIAIEARTNDVGLDLRVRRCCDGVVTMQGTAMSE
ncbi:UNVERIFIED_CONTAM: hypothetical protein GTU68_010602 [Idotea baltica]|nr:hypothetical protein [Idotea baltica]